MKQRCAVTLALLIAAAGCATSRKRVDVESAMTAPPGPMQVEYERRHGKSRELENCDRGGYAGAITEIAIEETPCYGICPTYTMTLHRDGAVEYQGRANIQPLGTRRGRIPVEQFRYLAQLADEIGYFELRDAYHCAVTDSPTVFTRVRRGEEEKFIRHYAPAHNGPARLRAFEDAVATVFSWIEWE